MAKAPRTAATTQVEPEVGQEAPQVAPAAPSHRATVPVAPRGPLTDATAGVVAGVRGALTGAAYTTDAGALALSREACAAYVGLLNVSPEGREYVAEALDYLDGRIARLAAPESPE